MRQGMTNDELRTICDRIGKDRLAAILDWTVRTIDRKLSGQHKITKADAVAIRAAVLAVEVVGSHA